MAVLFARADSIYKKISGCDVWDARRDARRYRGNDPVIAHPPCRGWGRLKAFAKPAPGEIELGEFAVDVVRRNGGVLEHPAGSTLWRAKGMPRPTMGKDEYGGWTILIRQCDFGHPAEKDTWLYLVGVDLETMPRPRVELGIPTRRVEQLGRAAREHTPERLARWLVELARCTDREPGAPADLAARLDPPGQVARADTAAPGQLQLGFGF